MRPPGTPPNATSNEKIRRSPGDLPRRLRIAEQQHPQRFLREDRPLHIEPGRLRRVRRKHDRRPLSADKSLRASECTSSAGSSRTSARTTHPSRSGRALSIRTSTPPDASLRISRSRSMKSRSAGASAPSGADAGNTIRTHWGTGGADRTSKDRAPCRPSGGGERVRHHLFEDLNMAFVEPRLQEAPRFIEHLVHEARRGSRRVVEPRLLGEHPD